jgi:hypothetical protein
MSLSWEYLFKTHTEMESESAIEWPGETGLDAVKRGVAKLGLDGWELATILYESGERDVPTWVFKRPAPESEGLGWTGQPEVVSG